MDARRLHRRVRLGDGAQRHRHGDLRRRWRGRDEAVRVSGGAYIDRMSLDYCTPCRYDRKARTGEDACPFTTLYWDVLDRNRATLRSNHRMSRAYANLDRLPDLPLIRERAQEVRARP